MVDPLVEEMTRLKLKLLEKRLENEREAYDSYDGQVDALQNALRRRDLLQRLKEQHMLEELGRPHTWAGPRRQQNYESFFSPPLHVYQSPPIPHPSVAGAPLHPPPPPPLPPRIIQQTIPQQPATIIQQLPQQQPLIAQIPPPLTVPFRSGSIKEDMVELMLMQNAQMHQIIMHNMMLKALPPMAFPQSGPGRPHASPHMHYSDVKENSLKARGIHHHHYYSPAPLPPIGYSALPSVIPTGQVGAYQPSIQHVTGPVTLPALNPITGYAGLK